MFNGFHWQTKNNKILLTFDDGPINDNTETILELLSKLNIKALFFLVGGNCEKYPLLVDEIIRQGHSVGNHTYNHKKMAGVSQNEMHNQINSLNELLYDKHNYKIKYFRPPHGRFDLRLNKKLQKYDMENVMWTLLTFDYKNDFNLVKFAVGKYLKNNSIVVLHDSIKSKNIITDSIKYIYDEANKRGYLFGEPDECLK
jgi:Predicted xylanase/chitin deacetylase